MGGCLLQCTVASLARDGPQLDCPVLNITGALSPQLAATLDLNTRLQPARSTWLKVPDTAILVDQLFKQFKSRS